MLYNLDKLHYMIKTYVKIKIKKLEDVSISNSSKEYYTNQKRIELINSIWTQIRITPDTIDMKHVKKLLDGYSLIYNI